MFFGFAQQIPAPGQVGNNDPHLITNQFRLHMLVRFCTPPHGRHMDSTFVRKRRFPNKRQMFIGREIGNFGHKMGEVVKAIQFPGRQTLAVHFEFEIGHDGDQVGIATALANSIDGSLDLDRALPNGRQRVDYRALGVVVGVDSERVRESRFEPVEDALEIPWQGPAVGVAQHDRLRAAPDGGLQRF
jgi:hypothetical protein